MSSGAASADVLRRERIGATEVLTIDRPHAANSFSAEVTAAFESLLPALEADEDLRAVVITGAGRRHFCAGGDIKQYRGLETREQLDAAFARPRRVLDRLEGLRAPVIAAVNGYALGGGAEMMLACDLRLAARSARVGFPYVKLGLIPGWNGTERLVRNCGHATAARLLLTGEPVDAEEARRTGLVHEVVDDDDLRAAALALGERFAGAAPHALAATKSVLTACWHLDAMQARAEAAEAFAELWLGDDHREAEAAFAEKRPPRFRGR